VGYTTVNEYLNQKSSMLRVRVQVLMDDGVTWYDLTDPTTRDRLVGISPIKVQQTRSIGAAEVTVGSLTFDNSDGFFSAPPPAGIATWQRHKLRVSVLSPPTPTVLVTALVDDMQIASDGGTMQMTSVGLSKRLIDKQADRVKNGQSWYTNRSIGWLVRQILLQEFTFAEVQSWGGVASSYRIPLADPTTRALSAYGRPPEFDGTVWRSDGTTIYGAPYAVVNTPATANYGAHWVGIGSDLWRYNPDGDVWTKWATVPVVRAGFRIMHIYVNATRNKVIVAAWQPDVPTPVYPTTAGNRSGALGGVVAILWADMTTPPAAYLTEFTGQPASIYTGHYCIRAGSSTAGSARIGAPTSASADANCAGVNIPSPAGHYTRQAATTTTPASPPDTRKKVAYNSKTDATDQGPAVVATTSAWLIDVPGFYAPFDALNVWPMDWRWNAGQYRGAFAHQNAGDKFVCSVVSWDGALSRYKFRLWTLDTNTGTWTDTTEWCSTSSGEHFAPFSFAFRADDAKLLTTAVCWKETAWSAGLPTVSSVEPYMSAVIEFNFPFVDSGAPVGMPTQTLFELNTNNTATSNPERYWVLWFDAIYGATNIILTSGLDIRNLSAGAGYVAVARNTSTSAYGNYAYSTGRLGGAVYDPGQSRFYIHDAGPSQLRSIDGTNVATGTIFWQIEDGGLPPVSGDLSLLAGIVLDVKRNALWGISGPGAGSQANAEVLGDAPLTGKYYLWQFANWLTDRVEIADFSNTTSSTSQDQALTLWDALEQLSAMMDGVFGFDASGAFYFMPRPAPSAPEVIFSTRPVELPGYVPDCVVQRTTGVKNLFNVVEMTPSIALLSAPTGSVRALVRPPTFSRLPWNYAPEVFQANNRNLNLLLRCCQGGLPGSENDGAVRKDTAGNTMVDYSPAAGQRIHKLRFEFLLYGTLVETQTTQAIGFTDTIVIPVDAAADVRGLDVSLANVLAYPYTDNVRIGDAEDYTVLTRTDNFLAGTSSLKLDRVIVTQWAIGTKVQIRTHGTNKWSGGPDGVTGGNWVVGGSTAGTEQTFTVWSTRDLCAGMVIRVDEDGTEEMRITQILNATQFKARRGVGGTLATLAHINGNVPIRAYYAPIVSSQFPEGTRFGIGGSGVSLRFPTLPDSESLPGNGTGNALGENPFMVGDTIEILCPGLTLQAQDQAKIVSYNVASIQKLQGAKLPWPSARTSRFAGYRQCSEIAKKVVSDYGSQHYGLDIAVALRWLPLVNHSYGVEDPKTLPSASPSASPNGDNPPVSPDGLHMVAGLAEAVSIDVMGDKLTLTLRAFNPHTW
jgi:hypothetical protein